MSDDTTNTTPRRRAASRPAGPPVTPTFVEPTAAPAVAAGESGAAKQRPAKKTAAPKRAPKKAAVAPVDAPTTEVIAPMTAVADGPEASKGGPPTRQEGRRFGDVPGSRCGRSHQSRAPRW